MPAAFDPAEVPDLAPLIDHALLQPRLGSESIERGCEQALHYGFAGICLASLDAASPPVAAGAAACV